MRDRASPGSVRRSWRTTPFLPSRRSRRAAASFARADRIPCR
ncbi:MAG: acetyltransferase [Acidobacteria bacterium]|nr:MAG: acetyltransferase [Acidobacteriota bacterium]